jgi:hypothetical protein
MRCNALGCFILPGVYAFHGHARRASLKCLSRLILWQCLTYQLFDLGSDESPLTPDPACARYLVFHGETPDSTLMHPQHLRHFFSGQ